MEHNKADALLDLLCRHFPEENLPKSCRTVLQTPRKVVLIEMPPGKYFHFGLFKGLLGILKTFLVDAWFDIFIHFDELPLVKSTNKQMWPILCRVKTDRGEFSHVFCVGSWIGCGKPIDSNDYLSRLVDELDPLLNEGIVIGNRRLTVRNIAFICDASAKSYV